MVADMLAERWGLPPAKSRFRGRIAEGRIPVGLEGGPGLEGRAELRGRPAVEDGVGWERDAELERSAGLRGGVSGGVRADDMSATAPPHARARGTRVAVLWPQTYMNDAGRSAGPARGSFKLPLDRVLVVHDEIDLPFGEVRTRLGGGLAGHNGLKSLRRELGSADFVRVRVGVGRPASTDPEIVSAYVLGRFREPEPDVRGLLDRACEAVERVVLGEGE
jgi:PTH1 family peptidyl-tRNA hydrolase